MLPHFAKPLSPLNRHKILRRIVMAKATSVVATLGFPLLSFVKNDQNHRPPAIQEVGGFSQTLSIKSQVDANLG
ncbi:MAG: hypothetical protein SRB2_01942 [Desulfobacteraceae bacterium Eth-SRB2]|nr:MAG: hypothetical protein SRB2_01942 [Desulfobacteraceae bacterium Eth-SRB2]